VRFERLDPVPNLAARIQRLLERDPPAMYRLPLLLAALATLSACSHKGVVTLEPDCGAVVADVEASVERSDSIGALHMLCSDGKFSQVTGDCLRHAITRADDLKGAEVDFCYEQAISRLQFHTEQGFVYSPAG